MKKLGIAIIASAIALGTGSANAGGNETISTTDMDLSNPKEVSALYMKIVETAETMCAKKNTSGLSSYWPRRRAMKKCIEHTVQNTVASTKIMPIKNMFAALPRSKRYVVSTEAEVRQALLQR